MRGPKSPRRSGDIKRFGEPALDTLEDAAHGPFRAAHALGHLLGRALLEPEIHDLALLVVQGADDLLKLVGEFGGFGGSGAWSSGMQSRRHAVGRGGPRFLVEAALLAEVKARLLPHLRQGDGAEQ